MQESNINPTGLTDSDYIEQCQPEEYYDDDYDHDDMFDTDSALGSCGFGTDEYYE